MAKENGTVSIKISEKTYKSLKAWADKKGYSYRGFADRALMEVIEKEIKLDYAKK